jgi:hypothetical protein
MEIYRLPNVRERTTVTKPIIIKKKTNIANVGFEPAALSSTPPNEFINIIKKRMEVYYSNPSTDNRNN